MKNPEAETIENTQDSSSDRVVDQSSSSGSEMAAASAMDGVAAAALRSVLQRVHQAAERCGRRSNRIRVVAVSKTKPVSLLRQVYDAGHRCFGENYVQEIVEKAPQVRYLLCICLDIILCFFFFFLPGKWNVRRRRRIAFNRVSFIY